MGVHSFDISIVNEMGEPSLVEFRNVFIQFGNFIRYRKWPLIEMYILNQYPQFPEWKIETKANSATALTAFEIVILYVCIYSIFFSLLGSSEVCGPILSLRFWFIHAVFGFLDE